MEKKLHYFGTDLRNHGHYIFNLSGDSMYQSEIKHAELTFDPYNTVIPVDNMRRKGQSNFQNIGGYSVLGIEGSCVDDRWGTRSVFFIKDHLTESEMVQVIKNTPIAMKIIEQIPFPVDHFKPTQP